MKKGEILFGIIMLLSVSMVFASVTCNPSSITASYNEDESKQVSTQCTNSGNGTTISITGETGIISTTETNFNPGVKTITISLSSSAPLGLHSGVLAFGTGDYVPIYFQVVEKNEPQAGCRIDIFPTVLTNVKVVQGEKKTRNVQLSVPLCYNSSIRINGVALQTDEKPLQLGEVSIGTMQPGNSVIIPVDIDSNGVSTGQYTDTLQFLVYDEIGNKINVPSVSISVLVTAGIQAITNFSWEDLPTCSLDAIDLSINSTSKLTCSRTNPNINIEPIIDYKYIKGVSVQETSSQYIYTFMPVILGETQLGAKFKYKGAELGSPFIQDVRISPSGSAPVGGITTRFSFYQGGAKKETNQLMATDTIIQVLDNKTGNVLTDFTLYVNGIESNSTITLESDKSYEIRASVPAYLDNVINFSVKQVPITLILNPSLTSYFKGDIVNISSNVNGTAFLLNNVVITSPYIFTTTGILLLEGVKEGYLTAVMNVTVRSRITYISIVPEIEEWKKGKKVVVQLSENATWEVYRDAELIASGDSNVVEFKMDKIGNYQIKANGEYVLSKIIEDSGWFSWLSWTNFKEHWIIGSIVIVLILGGGWLLLFRKKEEESKLMFAGSPAEE